MNADLSGDGNGVVHRQMTDRGDNGHGHRNAGRGAVNGRTAREVHMEIITVRLQVHRPQNGQYILHRSLSHTLAADCPRPAAGLLFIDDAGDVQPALAVLCRRC
ncbi:hypothetical protein D3C80_1653480 [compost metagenome]